MHADLSKPLSALCQSSVHPTRLEIAGLKPEQKKICYTTIIGMHSTPKFFKKPFKIPFFSMGVYIYCCMSRPLQLNF